MRIRGLSFQCVSLRILRLQYGIKKTKEKFLNILVYRCWTLQSEISRGFYGSVNIRESCDFGSQF